MRIAVHTMYPRLHANPPNENSDLTHGSVYTPPPRDRQDDKSTNTNQLKRCLLQSQIHFTASFQIVLSPITMLLKSPLEATENCINECTQIREAQPSMKYAYKESHNNGNGKNVNEQLAKDPTPERKLVDGNWAVASASYRMNDIVYIFPITPSSPIGEIVDDWAAATDSNGVKKYLNLWNQELKVCEMQSEGGAAGALHGALVSGSLATTYTSSQGLLLYIPNMYKIAGELLPTVIHVAARALAGHALSIYGDHSDVMLVRATGFAMVSSFSVQEAHDMAVVTQIATLNSSVPFLHFMDGFRTSHEINDIDVLSDDDLRKLMPWAKVEEHRQRALSPLHPTQRGTAQAPDVFMQLVESSNTHYQQVNSIFEKALRDFAIVTGRKYNSFEYHYFGSSHPVVAVVTMGSSVDVIKETLKYVKSENACIIGVRLFRPWDPVSFCKCLPRSVRRIATLDRTKESGAQGEPIYMDVCASLMSCKRNDVFVAGGRYGLASKDFSPRMAMAVIKNVTRKDVENVQHPFTVGIIDDVTHLSLPLGKVINLLPESVTQCVFWGFGSDGTVGANKEAVKIIGNYPDMTAQAYFEYDAKKSSGWTISHLRFSHGRMNRINAPYRIQDGRADYVACHHESYAEANKFDVARFIKKGGVFFLNTKIASMQPHQRLEALEANVSPKILRSLALRKVKFFIMDAAGLASKFGLRGKINMICMSVFFRLSGVLPIDDAMLLLRESVAKTYSNKGEDVVRKNHELLDVCADPSYLIAVDIPSRWSQSILTEMKRPYSMRHVTLIDDEKTRKFMEDIGDPVSRGDGDSIPISKFLENQMVGGTMIPGTTKYEKRRPNPSNLIPTWNASACTQCNQCIVVCPHAAIRPFIVTREETENSPYPSQFTSVKALGTELAGKRYTLQISPLDCTGCNACVEACPESPKALVMQDLDECLSSGGDQNWDYAINLPERGDLVDKYTLKGSQFQTPLMEFSSACSGCGETPYLKMLTQLFGERMIIANATGCSTIWGGSFPSNPYTVSKTSRRGPAWANSLFEDNSEFGYGMFSAMRHRRERLIRLVEEYIHEYKQTGDDNEVKEELGLVALLHEWLDVRDDKSDKCTLLFDRMKPLFQFLLFDTHTICDKSQVKLSQIYSDRDMFPKLSHWIVGGDGWAYDIGYGGLDHVEAFQANDVNVLVVDTEMFSNTGGQQSKATPAGASVKFAVGGKQQKKKNMGEIFMTYEHIYVASVCLSNQAHLLQTLIEADRYEGPSFVVAYAPCIQQQVRPDGLNDMFEECRYAVDSGYWPLYRYNPDLVHQGKNPFILDSKKLRQEVTSFLKREGRFINLQKSHPEIADELFAKMNRDVQHRMELMMTRANGYKVYNGKDEAYHVLFASETGNAQSLARDFADACTMTHTADALNDVDPEDLDGRTTIFFVATCGQGAMPRNGLAFYKALCERTVPFSEGTAFSVMGLGDSSYYCYCKAAQDIESAMLNLGARCILPMGLGDDASEQGLEEGLNLWLERIWPALGLPAPKEVPHISPIVLSYSKRAIISEKEDEHAIGLYYDSFHAKNIPIVKVKSLSEEGRNRDFLSFTFDIGEDGTMGYEPGDALEIFPSNDRHRVVEFLNTYSPDWDERTVIKLNHAFGIHGEISLGCLFTNVLDLFGKPKIHFLRQLATFEENDGVRQVMLDVDNLKKLSLEKGVTYADLLLLYKSATPPLPALLAMIPPMKPRAYSIASAPTSSPKHIELCILIDTWWCEEGMRYGLTCDMLRKLHEGDSVICRVKPGSMEGTNHQQPVVCVGIGSGLAPHMSFLRERVHAATQLGVDVAPFSLYFGNRFREREFLYRDELESIATEHSRWFTLHTAFSRDGKKKVYVQDLVAVTDDARRLLFEKQGMLYVCGNRNLPGPLKESIHVCFARGCVDSMSMEDVTKAVEDMYIHGRVQQEVW